MGMSKAQKTERETERTEAVSALKDILAGARKDTHGRKRIYCDVVSVAGDGMSRRMRVFIVSDGQLFNVTAKVATVLGWRFNGRARTVTVNGTGMDAGVHLVHTLAWYLFGKSGDDLLTREWM